MDVQRVEQVRAAEIQKDVQVVDAERQKATDVITADGEKQQTILIADGAKQQVVLKSEGDLASAKNEAVGILKVGESTAEAAKLLNLSSVDPQIVLAKEIGDNEGYQTYLIGIEGIEKDKIVGVEQAKALQAAGIQIISNSGDVDTGIKSVSDIFSSKGGTGLAALVEGVAQSDGGKALLSTLGVNKT
jgi:flotillin